MSYISSYLTALTAFFLADMAWLGTMSSRLYKPTLGDILMNKFSVMPAVAFYLLYPLGLLVFAIGPALRVGSVSTALLLGALFGLFTYGTYDLTNQATLRNWTTNLTVIDMGWGGVLGAITAASAFWVTSKFVG
jgi:uncharacterized membrane protein